VGIIGVGFYIDQMLLLLPTQQCQSMSLLYVVKLLNYVQYLYALSVFALHIAFLANQHFCEGF